MAQTFDHNSIIFIAPSVGLITYSTATLVRLQLGCCNGEAMEKVNRGSDAQNAIQSLARVGEKALDWVDIVMVVKPVVATGPKQILYGSVFFRSQRAVQDYISNAMATRAEKG